MFIHKSIFNKYHYLQFPYKTEIFLFPFQVVIKSN